MASLDIDTYKDFVLKLKIKGPEGELKGLQVGNEKKRRDTALLGGSRRKIPVVDY
jgi:hypothetical protein